MSYIDQREGDIKQKVSQDTAGYPTPLISLHCGYTICHSREGGNPVFSFWIPAFAGMTAESLCFPQQKRRHSNKTKTVIPSAAEESIEIAPRSGSLFFMFDFVRASKFFAFSKGNIFYWRLIGMTDKLKRAGAVEYWPKYQIRGWKNLGRQGIAF